MPEDKEPCVVYLPEQGWLIGDADNSYRQARDRLAGEYGMDAEDACAALDQAHLKVLNTLLPPGLTVDVDEKYGGFGYTCGQGTCKHSGGHDSPGGASMYALAHRQDPNCVYYSSPDKRTVQQIVEDLLVRRDTHTGTARVVGVDPESGIVFRYYAGHPHILLSGQAITQQGIDVRDEDGVPTVGANVTDVSRAVARWIRNQPQLP